MNCNLVLENLVAFGELDKKTVMGIHQHLSSCEECVHQEKLVSILQQLINRFPSDQNISRVYGLIGDIQLKLGRRNKALKAYQAAAVYEYDHHEIWDKIWGLQ